jgi:hypothetical protein
MRTRIILAAVAVLAAGLVLAPAALASGHTRLWWDGRTCTAWSSYEQHRTPAGFGQMLADSRHADTYLRVDAAHWNHVRNRHAGPAVIAAAEGYLRADCTTTGDE